jgi:hypothetical protein
VADLGRQRIKVCDRMIVRCDSIQVAFVCAV